jgi:hypothetical protein
VRSPKDLPAPAGMFRLNGGMWKVLIQDLHPIMLMSRIVSHANERVSLIHLISRNLSPTRGLHPTLYPSFTSFTALIDNLDVIDKFGEVYQTRRDFIRRRPDEMRGQKEAILSYQLSVPRPSPVRVHMC